MCASSRQQAAGPARRFPGWQALSLRTAAVTVLCCCTCAISGCGSSGQTTPKYEVRARSISGLGKVLADGAGFTLYLYVPDHHGPSRCSGSCIASWPPLVLPPGVTRPTAGPGIDPSLLGTTRRANGSLQVTYGKWPLYLWVGDVAAGQATGQDHDAGLWYVVSVAGSIDKRTQT
jgi:predicted lipoprotein with Yx(FWY)xxD motif